MRVLGAIIAGGQSRRFASDKAAATIDGRSLLDHACKALARQVDDLVLCGRASRRRRWIADRPEPGLGPLGGINAALGDARERGFDWVVTVPVDVFPLPPELVERLEVSGTSVFATQHLIGRWPVSLGSLLDRHLKSGQRSLRSWIAASGAVRVDDTDLGMFNINLPEDLNAAIAHRISPTAQLPGGN